MIYPDNRKMGLESGISKKCTLHTCWITTKKIISYTFIVFSSVDRTANPNQLDYVTL